MAIRTFTLENVDISYIAVAENSIKSIFPETINRFTSICPRLTNLQLGETLK